MRTVEADLSREVARRVLSAAGEISWTEWRAAPDVIEGRLELNRRALARAQVTTPLHTLDPDVGASLWHGLNEIAMGFSGGPDDPLFPKNHSYTRSKEQRAASVKFAHMSEQAIQDEIDRDLKEPRATRRGATGSRDRSRRVQSREDTSLVVCVGNAFVDHLLISDEPALQLTSFNEPADMRSVVRRSGLDVEARLAFVAGRDGFSRRGSRECVQFRVAHVPGHAVRATDWLPFGKIFHGEAAAPGLNLGRSRYAGPRVCGAIEGSGGSGPHDNGGEENHALDTSLSEVHRQPP